MFHSRAKKFAVLLDGSCSSAATCGDLTKLSWIIHIKAAECTTVTNIHFVARAKIFTVLQDGICSSAASCRDLTKLSWIIHIVANVCTPREWWDGSFSTCIITRSSTTCTTNTTPDSKCIIVIISNICAFYILSNSRMI